MSPKSVEDTWYELRDAFSHFFPDAVEMQYRGGKISVTMTGRGWDMCADSLDEDNALSLDRATITCSGKGYGLMVYALFSALAVRTGRSSMMMFTISQGAYNWFKAGATLQAKDPTDWETLSCMLAHSWNEVSPLVPSQEDRDWFADKIQLRHGTKDLWDITDSPVTMDHRRYRTVAFALLSGVTAPAVHDFTSQAARDRLLNRLSCKQPDFTAQIRPMFK